jgi:two-component system, sensor histidine kinase and response regulator
MDLSTMETMEEPLVIAAPGKLAEDVRSKLIIVVDDDGDTVASVASIGRKAGYEVRGLTSGEECLEILSRIAPHLIMLDINMPQLDGFETCRRLRLNPNGKHVPVAFLTARTKVEDVKDGVAAGADDFIVKPFNASYLLERMMWMISISDELTALRRLCPPNRPPGAWVPDRQRRGWA